MQAVCNSKYTSEVISRNKKKWNKIIFAFEEPCSAIIVTFDIKNEYINIYRENYIIRKNDVFLTFTYTYNEYQEMMDQRDFYLVIRWYRIGRTVGILIGYELNWIVFAQLQVLISICHQLWPFDYEMKKNSTTKNSGKERAPNPWYLVYFNLVILRKSFYYHE